MKVPWSKLFVVTAAFLLLAGACVASPPPPMPTAAPPTATPIPPSPTPDPAAPVQAWVDALNSGDVNATLALFTDDLKFDVFEYQAHNKDELRGIFDWLAGLETKYQIKECQTKEDRVVCTMPVSDACIAGYDPVDGLMTNMTFVSQQDGKISQVSGYPDGFGDYYAKWISPAMSWMRANRAEELAKAESTSDGREAGAINARLCREYGETLKATPAVAAPTKVAGEDVASTAQPTVEAVEPPNRVPLVVASVSMNAHTDKAANLKEFERYMTEAAAQGVHLVVFPEIALQQNPGWGHLSDQPTLEQMAYVNETAEPIPGESTGWLTEKAKQLGVYVIYGMTERGDDGKLYNTSVFLGPEGVLARYRKNGLWDAATGGNEHLFYARGADKGMVVNSPLGKIGLTICIEMYLDYGVELGAKGVDLMVNVSAWPSESDYLYTQAAATTARACKCWHVVANQVGTVGYERYGHSRIIDPNGTVIADTGSGEGLVIAQTGLFIDSGALSSNGRP